MEAKKRLTYDYDLMKQAAGLLDKLSVTGIQNFRILADVANILDSGELSEENEEMTIKHKKGTPSKMRKAGEKDGVESEEVCQDKLEKQAINGNSTGCNESKPD